VTAATLIDDALTILQDLGFPRAQLNERSALCLLAITEMWPGEKWGDATNPLVGITPMMEFARNHYGREYAPNTRETFRRQTMHQFVAAGLALYNPDDPGRAVNSPKAVYQIAPEALDLLRCFGTPKYSKNLTLYLQERDTLAARYAAERDLARLPVQIGEGREIKLSAGEHSALIKALVEEFASRFVPGSRLVYVGDTGDKIGYFDEALLADLGVRVDTHGKMPDAVFYDTKRDWLVLAEAVTSHGPVDGKRREELKTLFAGSTAGLVYVTAFPTRAVMARYLAEVAWETEVWVADAPTHLVHFNGVRFLGPYDN
jgi:hypothetical protein